MRGSPSVEQSLLSSYQSHLGYLLLQQPDKTLSCKSTDLVFPFSKDLSFSSSQDQGQGGETLCGFCFTGSGFSLLQRMTFCLLYPRRPCSWPPLAKPQKPRPQGLSSCSLCLQHLPCFLLCRLPMTLQRCFYLLPHICLAWRPLTWMPS